MVPVTPMFPLFKLPYLAWRDVLKNMTEFEILISSLCNRNLKRIVRSLFIKPCTFNIELHEKEIRFDISRSGNNGLKIVDFLYTLQGPTTLSMGPSVHLETEFDVKYWVKYLMEVFNCDGICLSFHCDNFDIEHVNRELKALEVHGLNLKRGVSSANQLKALVTFQPTKKLGLSERPNVDEPLLRDILTRKYDEITLKFQLSVEELISLKSASIELWAMRDVEFNTFLNRWVEGCNPEINRLDVGVCSLSHDFRAIPLDGLECHQLTGKWKDSVGFEVRNRFGKKASVCLWPHRSHELFMHICYLHATTVYFDSS